VTSRLVRSRSRCWIACWDWVIVSSGSAGALTVTLRRTVFDVEAARAQIALTCSFADVDEWTADYLNARAGDAEVIGAFGPRAGR
jgi:hypothetical protein